MTDYTEPATRGNIKNGDSQILGAGGVFAGSRTSNTLYVTGTWADAALTISLSPDGTRWFPFAETMTSDDFYNFSGRFRQVKISVAGGDGTTDLDWEVL